MADTVKIYPNQDFKHGTETFKAGESYDVPEGLAYYFAQVGWTRGKPGSDRETMTITPGDVATLDIQDGQIGHTSEVK